MRFHWLPAGAFVLLIASGAASVAVDARESQREADQVAELQESTADAIKASEVAILDSIAEFDAAGAQDRAELLAEMETMAELIETTRHQIAENGELTDMLREQVACAIHTVAALAALSEERSALAEERDTELVGKIAVLDAQIVALRAEIVASTGEFIPPAPAPTSTTTTTTITSTTTTTTELPQIAAVGSVSDGNWVWTLTNPTAVDVVFEIEQAVGLPIDDQLVAAGTEFTAASTISGRVAQPGDVLTIRVDGQIVFESDPA